MDSIITINYFVFTLISFLLYRISSHAYSLLEKEGLYPNGLILEAPFTKIRDAIEEYPLTRVNSELIEMFRISF